MARELAVGLRRLEKVRFRGDTSVCAGSALCLSAAPERGSLDSVEAFEGPAIFVRAPMEDVPLGPRVVFARMDDTLAVRGLS